MLYSPSPLTWKLLLLVYEGKDLLLRRLRAGVYVKLRTEAERDSKVKLKLKLT